MASPTRYDVDVAAVAALLGDPARCAMLHAMLDGRALPASGLAEIAGVSRATASAHLARLVEAGLVVVEPRGRHRFHTLAGPDVAHALEALAPLAPARPVTSLRESIAAGALASARTCYDHFAGRLGVAVRDAWLERDLVRPVDERDHEVTGGGREVFTGLGLDVEAAEASRRNLLRSCGDWTERRPHLAGSLPAAFCTLALDRGWVARRPRDRGLRVSNDGARAFREAFGVELQP